MKSRLIDEAAFAAQTTALLERVLSAGDHAIELIAAELSQAAKVYRARSG
jgi:hypothetical protein